MTRTEANPSVIVRGPGEISYEETKEISRPGHLYRGMTEVEYRATVGAGKPVHSTGAYSLAHEGTNFGEDFSTAESYVDFGRDDPRKTGRPNYVVEVDPTSLNVQRNRHGEYWAFEPVPLTHVTRVWRMEPRDGAVVAVERSLEGVRKLKAKLLR